MSPMPGKGAGKCLKILKYDQMSWAIVSELKVMIHNRRVLPRRGAFLRLLREWIRGRRKKSPEVRL